MKDNLTNMIDSIAKGDKCEYCKSRDMFYRSIFEKENQINNSMAYVKVLQYISKNDIGLTNEERDFFIFSSTHVHMFLTSVRNCVSTDRNICSSCD